MCDHRYWLLREMLGRIKKGPTKLTDEFLGQIADIYRHANRTGQHEIVAVIKATGAPGSTASRWVKEARKRGLLPPTRPGVAKA